MKKKYNLIDKTIEQRGFAWQCVSSLKEKTFRIPREGDKAPCGHWNWYYGRKWASSKKDPNWAEKCRGPCSVKTGTGKRRQLSPEKLHNCPHYVETREEAKQLAAELNEDMIHQAERAQAIKNQHQERGPLL